MKPARRLLRTAVLLAAPAVLAVRVARAVAERAGSAIRGSEPEPAPVAGPLFAAPEPPVVPVPAFSSTSAPKPAVVTKPASPPSAAAPKAAAAKAAPKAPAAKAAAPKPAVAEPTPVFASELPIPAYDALSAADATTAIKDLTDAEQVRLVLRHEEENAKRTTVHKAARLHLESLEGASL